MLRIRFLKIRFLTALLFVSGSMTSQIPSKSIPEGMVLIPGGTFMMGSNDHQQIAAPKLPEFWGKDIAGGFRCVMD